jgi:hypothetical protein
MKSDFIQYLAPSMNLPPILTFPRLLLAGCLLLSLVAAPRLTAREVRTIYLAGTGSQLYKAYLLGAKTALEVELPQRNLSPEAKLPNGDLTLIALPSAPVEGTPIPEGAPRCTIPESWQRCILIFLGDPKNTVFPVRIIPVDASSVNFPKGSTRIYNLSKTTILGQFGKERVHLESGKSTTFGAPISDFGGYPMGIDCIPEGEKTPRAVCRSFWQHDPEARQVLFVVPQIDQVLPRVWSVLDKGGDKEEAAP